MSVKPIGPEDVARAKTQTFPDEVIEAFNELIAAGYTGGRSAVRQEDAVNLIMDKMDAKNTPPIGSGHRKHLRNEIFAKGWLNVEEIYRAQGWKVVYDKPGFNESYPATFEFSRPK